VCGACGLQKASPKYLPLYVEAPDLRYNIERFDIFAAR
jgi:hypothetical protein